MFGAKVNDVISDMNKAIAEDDVFPVCFVISKFDLVDENYIEQFKEFIHRRLIKPLSERNAKLLLCICPASVVDASHKKLKPINIEWPFLFAAGGTVLRNSQELMRNAADDWEVARQKEEAAKELITLRRSKPWRRFLRWIKEDFVTAGSLQRTASVYRNSAGRKIKHARDDRELARDVWAAIAVDGRSQGVQVIMDGEDVDPRSVVR